MASERRPLSTAYASRQVFESPVLEDLEYTTTQSGDSLEVERERLDRDTTFDAPEYASQSTAFRSVVPAMILANITAPTSTYVSVVSLHFFSASQNIYQERN
jgi:hypothetical protein